MSAGKNSQKKLGLTLISALAGLMAQMPVIAGEPLQGNVQETGAVSPTPDLQLAVPMSEPVVKKTQATRAGPGYRLGIERSGLTRGPGHA
ncbi:MAG: hypothetical protein IPP57_07605 [Candidatus Obscuribacter sp.]|nr:hypothetical protein [Candidatus Obscuribacter sp.]